MKKSGNLLTLFLIVGILGNFLWFFLYFQFILRSEWLEGIIVQLHMKQRSTPFVMASYLRDMGLFAYLIFSMVFFWRITKSNQAYPFLGDAIRAIIILFALAIVFMQFFLFLSYRLDPVL